MLVNEFETDVIAIRDRLRQHLDDGCSGSDIAMAPPQALRVLQDFVAIEVLRYVRHVQTAMAAERSDRGEIAVEFRDVAANELVHSIQVARRVRQLGGSTNFDAVTVIKRAHVARTDSDQIELVNMLKEDLAVERVVISCCDQIGRRLDVRDAATRHLMDSVGAEAIEHVGGLRQLLTRDTELTGDSNPTS